MKLVLFDVDGTLVDSQNIIVEALNRSFRAMALEPPPRKAALSVVGLSLPQAFAALVGADGPVVELAQGYKDAFTELRLSGEHEEALFPGAAAAVERLAARDDLILGLATGKSRPGVDRLLDRHGWRGLFATVQTADDNPSKPAPGMIFSALMETGADVAATFMIGDTTFDMSMARAAGARAIGVDWGYHDTAALADAGAHEIIDEFSQLEAAISRAGGIGA